jgi:hypothetical protein
MSLPNFPPSASYFGIGFDVVVNCFSCVLHETKQPKIITEAIPLLFSFLFYF